MTKLKNLNLKIIKKKKKLRQNVLVKIVKKKLIIQNLDKIHKLKL